MTLWVTFAHAWEFKFQDNLYSFSIFLLDVSYLCNKMINASKVTVVFVKTICVTNVCDQLLYVNSFSLPALQQVANFQFNLQESLSCCCQYMHANHFLSLFLANLNSWWTDLRSPLHLFFMNQISNHKYHIYACRRCLFMSLKRSFSILRPDWANNFHLNPIRYWQDCISYYVKLIQT